MPAPLWEDAKNWLIQQGVDLNRPDAHVVLNDVMNKMAQGLVTRPSYGGNYGAPIGGDILSSQMQSSIPQTELPSPIPSPAPVTKGSAEGYGVPNRGAPVARNAPSKSVAAKPPPGAPGSEPDIPGGVDPTPGQAQAASGSAPQLPGSGSDSGSLIGSIMDWISQNGAKVAAGLGTVAGVAGASRMLRPTASAGMRSPSAPLMSGGASPGSPNFTTVGGPYTPPGGGPGSGMGVMPPGIGANPITGTLPLGAGPSATMALPPPAVSLSTHGAQPMGAYGPVQQTGVVPSGRAQSVPPDVINQGGPNIEALLTGPKNVTKDASGGRIRSPRARTAPAPKAKPTSRGRPTSKQGPSMLEMMNIKRDKGTPAPKRTKGGKTAADADQNDARTKRNRAAQSRSR